MIKEEIKKYMDIIDDISELLKKGEKAEAVTKCFDNSEETKKLACYLTNMLTLESFEKPEEKQYVLRALVEFDLKHTGTAIATDTVGKDEPTPTETLETLHGWFGTLSETFADLDDAKEVVVDRNYIEFKEKHWDTYVEQLMDPYAELRKISPKLFGKL